MDPMKKFETLDQFVDSRPEPLRLAEPKAVPAPGGPVVALSRQAGCEARSVVDLLAGQLGLEVYDRTLVEKIASVTHKSEESVSRIDEKSHSRLGEWITTTQNLYGISTFSYLRGLKKVVSTIAARGSAVIVGRGAGFLLPPGTRVALRLIAPFEMRLRTVVKELNVAEISARKYLEDVERERRLFVKRHLHADLEDPANYDAVINLDRVAPEAVPGIVRAILDRGLGQRPPETTTGNY